MLLNGVDALYTAKVNTYWFLQLYLEPNNTSMLKNSFFLKLQLPVASRCTCRILFPLFCLSSLFPHNS